MRLRLATFNTENLMQRFDFSGLKHPHRVDRALQLFDIDSDAEFRSLEKARAVSIADDTRQMTGLTIADCEADIICLQEVENMDALNAFEKGYLYRMLGSGYRQKHLIEGNDGRGIDVAIMAREETAAGDAIAITEVRSHKEKTFGALDLFTDELKEFGIEPEDRIFRRDCLEVDVTIGGVPITFYIVHNKSMGGMRDGVPGREATMPIRMAECRAIRHIITERFGSVERSARKRWAICGDFNDYYEKIEVTGSRRGGYAFSPVKAGVSSLDVLLSDGFSVDPTQNLPVDQRWSLYHARGQIEQHLCQLDYILLSPKLAKLNTEMKPEFIRAGQPYRTPVPEAQHFERYPRVGWDRPKASDHSALVMELTLTQSTSKKD